MDYKNQESIAVAGADKFSHSRKFYLSKYILTILILFNIIIAQSGWRNYGWQLYQNAGDARSIALGNTMIADDHIISTLWNPGGINENYARNLTYGHQSRFAGIIQSDLIAYQFQIKNNRTFNILFLHESVSKIPNTQNLLLDWGLDGVPNSGDLGENNGYLDEGERINNDAIKYFNQHQFGVHLSTLINIFETNIGIAIKSIVHTLDNHTGSGISVDIGMIKSYWRNSNVGVSIQNIIPGLIVWDSGVTELSKPRAAIGISQMFNLSKIPLQILLLSDIIFNVSAQSLSDDFNIGSTGANFRFGTEITYSDRLNIRLGRNQLGFYSIGLGIAWTNMELNYAYRMNSNLNDFGASHVVSFSLNPSWLTSKLKQQMETK